MKLVLFITTDGGVPRGGSQNTLTIHDISIQVEPYTAGFRVVEGPKRSEIIIDRAVLPKLDNRWWASINAHCDHVTIV